MNPFDRNNNRKSLEMPADIVRAMEDAVNWVLPGCQLFYRDTNTNLDVRKLYPVGAIVRAGFFVDVTVKAQRPVTNTRFIIASAHCAKLYEAMPDPDFVRWRFCTLHFNSYFKVMDVYEYQGVTQVFLLHIPMQALPLFTVEHTFELIQGVSQTDFVGTARKSLEDKMAMDVFPDTTEPALLDRMTQLVGYTMEGQSVGLDYVEAPPAAQGMDRIVRELGDDLKDINYPIYINKARK